MTVDPIEVIIRTLNATAHLSFREQQANAILLALSAAGITLSQWQPIETAPKDGTAILMTNYGIGMITDIGCYVPVQFRRYGEPDWPDWWARFNSGSPGARSGMRPDLWMPLPEHRAPPSSPERADQPAPVTPEAGAGINEETAE